LHKTVKVNLQMDGGVLYVGFVTIGVVIESFHSLGCKMQVLP